MIRLIIFGMVVLLLFGCVIGPQEQNQTGQNNDQGGSTQPTCTDGDNGKNIQVKSSAISDGTTYLDSCADQTSVKEYYCSGGYSNFEIIQCPTNNTCSNGACVYSSSIQSNNTQPNNTQQNNTQQNKCTDSDGGLNYDNFGTVIVGSNSYQDSCQSTSNLVEYSCEGKSMKQTTISCGVGISCQNGACIQFSGTCTDSDANEEYKLGQTIQYSGGVVAQSKSDACFDNNTIKEFFCEGNIIKNKPLTCPPRTICDTGLCRPLCEDHDYGVQSHAASYVSDQNGSHYDFCSTQYLLSEYVCNNDVAATTSVTCSTLCKDGRCYEENELTCKESNAGKTVSVTVGATVLDSATDDCVDYATKRDYKCAGSKVDSVSVPCGSTKLCYEGACQTIPNQKCIEYDDDGTCTEYTKDWCYDLDDNEPNKGRNTASFVVLTYTNSVKDVKADVCFTPAIVTEYFCDGDTGFKLDYLTCASDERCLNGACKYQYTCADSDNGVYLTPGAAYLYDNGVLVSTERDACNNDKNVKEMSCGPDGRIIYTIITCPDGTLCDSTDGSCK